MSDTYVEGGNYYGNRRHYGTEWITCPHGAGLWPICGTHGDSYDQAWHDRVHQRFGGKRVVVADLPLCKRCVRVATKAAGCTYEHTWTAESTVGGQHA